MSAFAAEFRRVLNESLAGAGWFLVLAVLLLGVGICLGVGKRKGR